MNATRLTIGKKSASSRGEAPPAAVTDPRVTPGGSPARLPPPPVQGQTRQSRRWKPSCPAEHATRAPWRNTTAWNARGRRGGGGRSNRVPWRRAGPAAGRIAPPARRPARGVSRAAAGFPRPPPREAPGQEAGVFLAKAARRKRHGIAPRNSGLPVPVARGAARGMQSSVFLMSTLHLSCLYPRAQRVACRHCTWARFVSWRPCRPAAPAAPARPPLWPEGFRGSTMGVDHGGRPGQGVTVACWQ